MTKRKQEFEEGKEDTDIGSTYGKKGQLDVENEDTITTTTTVSSTSKIIEHNNKNSFELNTFQNLKGIKLVTEVIEHPKDFCKKFFKLYNSFNLQQQEEENPSLVLSNSFLKTCRQNNSMSGELDKDDGGGGADDIDKKVKKLNKKLVNFSYIFSCESELFKTFLKYGMRHSENTQLGSNLIEMLIGIFEHGIKSIQKPTLGIEMMLSHSKAEIIFLEKVQRPQKIIPVKKEEEDDSMFVPTKSSMIEKIDIEKFTIIKTSLLKLWTILVKSFKNISKISGTEDDKKILENSVPYLMQMYGGTMSPSDILVFELLKMYTSSKLDVIVETLPLFGPKCFDTPKSVASNPLFAHSMRANTILTCISDTKAYHTALQFDPKKLATTSASYDLRFLLPLLCHILDERNICDGSKVIANGWIYLIIKGMSLEDVQLRSMAFLAYQRLIQCFLRPKSYRNKDTKIYLHFLYAVRRGIRELGECKISHLLSTWIIFVWEVLRQPSNSMFQRVTHCLFAKPIIEMTILTDFVAFYNDGDDNKESRTWILNVLYCGLKYLEDWNIVQKSPVIKFLCASFILEKVKTQKTIITILTRGAEIPEITKVMVDKYSILLWLSNITTTSHSLKMDLKKFYETLVCNCPETEHRKIVFEFVKIRLDFIINSVVSPVELNTSSDIKEEPEIVEHITKSNAFILG